MARPLKKGEQLDGALAELPMQSAPEPFRGSAEAEVSGLPKARLREPEFKKGDLVATREAYGSALVKLGECFDNVVALDGDTKNSTFSEKFMKAFPDRFFECFIAEQNMVGAAIGLSKKNKIPFASTFAAFFGRGMDHLRMGGHFPGQHQVRRVSLRGLHRRGRAFPDGSGGPGHVPLPAGLGGLLSWRRRFDGAGGGPGRRAPRPGLYPHQPAQDGRPSTTTGTSFGWAAARCCVPPKETDCCWWLPG